MFDLPQSVYFLMFDLPQSVYFFRYSLSEHSIFDNYHSLVIISCSQGPHLSLTTAQKLLLTACVNVICMRLYFHFFI